MKNDISVSVIVPVYNVAPYLSRCLDSVLNQTLQNLEVICIDDGSTDASFQILSDYATRDARVIVRRQSNLGAGTARNNAIRAARGEFIAFMDGDDFYPDDCTLSRMYDAARANNVKICGGGVIQLRGEELVSDPSRFEAGYTFAADGIMAYSDYQFDWGYWRFIYDREFLLENNLFFPDYLRYQDPPFFVRAMTTAQNFYALAAPTYVYRVSYKQVAWTPRKVTDFVRGLTDVLRICNKYGYDRLRETMVVTRINTIWDVQIFEPFARDKQIRAALRDMLAVIDFGKISAAHPEFKLLRFYRRIYKPIKHRKPRGIFMLDLKLLKMLHIIDRKHYTRAVERRRVLRSGLFNRRWYLRQYPDVAAAHMDPAHHYLKYGWGEGRNPSPKFSTTAYLTDYPDVAAVKMCPLLHYIQYGHAEGRKIRDAQGNSKRPRARGRLSQILTYPIRLRTECERLSMEITQINKQK